MKALYRLGYHPHTAEEHMAQGAPPPEQVIAHTNLILEPPNSTRADGQNS
jgi:hypothetical protein